jgi:ubiquinone/menaquinone biosynthesis C-methylase UbiE
MRKSYEQINAEQQYSETDPFTPDRYRQFFHHFPAHVENVLDVGCNTGRGGRVLKECNPHLEIIGLDCLQPRLDKIPKNIYSRTICSYTTNIEAADSSFDTVVAGEFIEHIYPDDVLQTLKEFYRVIKPNGRLLLTTPNPNYLKLKLTGGTVLGGAHVSQHYPEDLKKDLEAMGFVNVKIIGSGKVTRFLGEKFPFKNLYGSYLATADKN